MNDEYRSILDTMDDSLNEKLIKMRFNNLVGYFRIEALNGFECSSQLYFIQMAYAVVDVKQDMIVRCRMPLSDVFDRAYGK